MSLKENKLFIVILCIMFLDCFNFDQKSSCPQGCEAMDSSPDNIHIPLLFLRYDPFHPLGDIHFHT